MINSTTKVFAIVDPTAVSNNKFGIHIMNENDLQNAANLVNTNGGDWGYVTIVITEAERDRDRWQKVFDQMRRLHLIPIVRLATKATGPTWDVPQEAEINNWIAFLNSLNWVTQNRYVIINNEPNHAKEWGGRIDPAGYAIYLKNISVKLKAASPDFFVLPAGLDPAASNTKITSTEDKFILGMLNEVPDIFNYIDGWTSHPYPNASISIYDHELVMIKKNLPVFITETGWPNDQYSEPQIEQKLVSAYKNIWSDPKVIAVTPFILDYTSPPFDVFSWKKSDGSFYSFYKTVSEIPKIKGEPIQIESGQILAAVAEPAIITGMDFFGAILAKNNGQTVWDNGTFSIGSESTDFILKNISLNSIEPMKIGLILFRAHEAQNSGIYTNSIFLTNLKGKRITNSFSIEAAFINLGKDKIQELLGLVINKWFK